MSNHKGTIYRQQPSSSGQLMVVSTGATVYDQNVVAHTTLSLTLKNHGLSVLAPSTKARFTLAQPVKGCRKEILVYSTRAIKVKTDSTVTSFNNTSCRQYNFASTGATLAKQGMMLRLIGASTTTWYGIVIQQSTVKTAITLTTST